MTVNELFKEARRRIAVPDDVLKQARKRRDAIRSIVEGEFDTLRTFGSGSLAHGTQNDPLNDADAGVVLDRRVYDDLGPDADGPCATVEEIRGVLRTWLKKEYPDVRFYTGGHRAIRVNFMERIQLVGGNFTADLIVAIRRDEGGLYIPDLDKDGWDPSDPPELRWLPEHRLVGLIEMARLHLFREEYWRRTGGWDGGEWLGPEIHPGEEEAEEATNETGAGG